MDPHTITWVAVAYVLAQAIGQFMTWLATRESNRRLKENTEITKEVHERVGQKVTELATAHVELAREQGRREGVISEQQRHSAFAQHILKQANERTQRIIRLNECIRSNGAIRCKVLVVEDSEIDALNICRELDVMHMTCDLASSGVQAVEKIRANGYVAAFVDLGLGVDDGGLPLVQQMMVANGKIPLFIVSGYLNNDIRGAAGVIGVIDVIEKPVTTEKLKAALFKLSDDSI